MPARDNGRRGVKERAGAHLLLGLHTHLGIVLPDAPPLLHVRHDFRRITLQHADLDAHVCAYACIHLLRGPE